MKLTGWHMPFSGRRAHSLPPRSGCDTHTLDAVSTSIVDGGWCVCEAGDPDEIVGFICDHDKRHFGIRFAGEPEQPHSFGSFDGALDFFAEYALASKLGS